MNMVTIHGLTTPMAKKKNRLVTIRNKIKRNKKIVTHPKRRTQICHSHRQTANCSAPKRYAINIAPNLTQNKHLQTMMASTGMPGMMVVMSQR